MLGVVRDETFVGGSESTTFLTFGQFDEPHVGDLVVSLNGVGRGFLVAEVVAPELMLGMGKDSLREKAS